MRRKRAEVPGPFTIVSEGSGQGKTTRPKGTTDEKEVVDFTYVQRWDARGTRATFTLDPSPNQTRELPLRTGVVEGPVEFTFTRTETVVGEPVGRVSRATGRADRLEMGIEGDGYRLTAIGNVEVDGEGPGMLGKVRAQQLVVIFDKDMKPIRYQGSGTPSSVKATPAGGG